MQKILLLLLIITLLYSCDLTKIEKENITNTGTISGTGQVFKLTLEQEIKKKKEIEAEIRKQKVIEIKKRLALKGLIIKGDINLENGEYTSALIKYLQIHKEIPNDESIINKLGDVYYNMKNYKKAYSYYTQIKDYIKLDKDKASITLISSISLNTKNINYINNELDSLGLDKEKLFYYKTSLVCVKDYSLCRENFQNYFNQKRLKDVLKKSGKTEIIKEENIFDELQNIEDAFTNYTNFQIEDILYKGALISGAFFENGLYPIAIETSKILLVEKHDYKPLLKLIARSYYELGNYVEAKIYLIEYNKLVKEDNEASYFLGVVYSRLHEYMLSNIHFKKALRTGFEDVYDLNKRLLINYYELGEIDKMLGVLKTIIKENKKDVTVEDYNLAIYYHIVNDKIEDSKNIAKEALKKYPDSDIFNGYMGWILMNEVNEIKSVEENSSNTGTTLQVSNNNNNNENIYSEAEKYIDEGLKINSKNPMLTLVKGKLELYKGDAKKAFIYFKKTISLNNNGDFGKIAKIELENITISE